MTVLFSPEMLNKVTSTMVAGEGEKAGEQVRTLSVIMPIGNMVMLILVFNNSRSTSMSWTLRWSRSRTCS